MLAVMLAVACPPAFAADMAGAMSVTVGPPPPSTVTGVTITPNPVGCRKPGAGSRKPDVGDGNWWIAPINSLPFTTTHTWAAAGTYTVLARGYVTCGGEVTRAVTVGSAPEPEALVSTGVSPLDAWALEGDETRLDVLEAGPWVPSDERMFAPRATVPLTVDLTGTGSGTVTSSPGGLVCAGTDGHTCSANFTAGTTVTLSPTPDAGSTFAGWGGACSGAGTCTVPLASARLVVATFTVPPPWVTQYHHTDALGSVRAVTDTTGAVVRTHDYHPFGEGVGVAAGTDPVRFTGKPRDAETGLDYFGARYYAQGAGRFTTVDPVYTWRENLVDPERWNRYAYVRNNPGRYVDPDGRILWPVVAVAAAAAILTPSDANAPKPGDPTFASDTTGEAIGNAAAAAIGEGIGAAIGGRIAALGRSLLGKLGLVDDTARVAGTTVGEEMGILRDAARGRGNFGLGSATADDAARLGQAWLGKDYTVAKDGKALISADGLRQYRPPTYKPNLDRTQANFEWRPVPRGAWGSNGHLDIYERR